MFSESASSSRRNFSDVLPPLRDSPPSVYSTNYSIVDPSHLASVGHSQNYAEAYISQEEDLLSGSSSGLMDPSVTENEVSSTGISNSISIEQHHHQQQLHLHSVNSLEEVNIDEDLTITRFVTPPTSILTRSRPGQTRPELTRFELTRPDQT